MHRLRDHLPDQLTQPGPTFGPPQVGRGLAPASGGQPLDDDEHLLSLDSGGDGEGSEGGPHRRRHRPHAQGPQIQLLLQA